MKTEDPTTPEDPTSSENGACRADPRRGRLVAGGVMLAVALIALAGQHFGWSWHGRGMLALIGIAFVVWAALARSAGLLVPGGVLLGVGTGAWLQATYGPAAFLWSMAGGFILISVLSLALFGARKNTWWTLWPAGGLVFAGAVVAGGPEVRSLFAWLREFWPWLLLAAALVLLGSGFWKKS